MWCAAVSNSARSGTSPTISLHVGLTPRFSASSFTASYARQIGVVPVSVRFIETCAWPSTSSPSPFTAGSPPPDVRTAFATSFATARFDAGPR